MFMYSPKSQLNKHSNYFQNKKNCCFSAFVYKKCNASVNLKVLFICCQCCHEITSVKSYVRCFFFFEYINKQTLYMEKCLEDDYEHFDDKLKYVLENILMPDCNEENKQEYEELHERYHSYILNPCQCASNDKCEQCHKENYVFNGAELVLNKTEFIYECSSICNCNIITCCNRLVQFGPRKHLRIIDSPLFKSKGVITAKFIPKGGFICEYAGELLTLMAAKKRLVQNTQHKKANYILCLRESALHNTDDSPSIVTIVDPTYQGNIGRYLNHSCEPNCQIMPVRVDCIIPKIAIFAKRDIAAHEELCFNYAGNISDCTKLSSTACLCGAATCLGFLPSVTI